VIRTVLRRVGVIGALGACAIVAAASCSRDRDEASTGSIGMNLLVAPGISVVEVGYTISKSGLTDIVGTIAVPDDDDVAQATIYGLAQGGGYTLALSAVSTDGKYSCKGQSEFSVVAGASTTVGVDLQCRGEDEPVGGVIGKGTFNVCPNFSAYTVSPDTAQVGDTIALSVSATDPNTNQTLTYSWSGSGGGFSSTTEAKTTFTCGSAGTQTLVATVTDGKCADTQNITVTCLDSGSGTGGQGTGGAATGGAATGGTETGGAATGGTETGGAATGGAETGGAATGGAATGGAATGGAATGGAETGGAATGGAATGGAGGGRPVGPVCDQCSTESAFVNEAKVACDGDALCSAYVDCARVNDCVLPGIFDEAGCFCGYTDPNEGSDIANCFSRAIGAEGGGAFGPCIEQVTAAAGSTDISDINEAWILPDSPLGKGNELLRRQMEICSADGQGGQCFPYH